VDIDDERFYERGPRPSDVPEGTPWDAWTIALWPVEELAGLGAGEGDAETQLAYLAAFGLLAPTTHNTVPQRFELLPDDAGLRVWLDRRDVLADSDPTGRQAVVSVGCVLANVELAAQSVGLSARVETHELAGESLRPYDGEGDPLVGLATVHFSSADPSSAPPTEWRELMRRRKMVRAEYDRAPLPDALVEELDAATAAHEGLGLHLITDGPTKLFLGKFQELADATVINREGFARELGHWLLANDDPSDRGMRGWEFGLALEPARRFHLGLKGELSLLPDETAGFAKAGNIGMRSASAVGVLTAAADDAEHWLTAGRVYQRIALVLLREGFVAAMHAGITEVTAPNMALRGRLRTRSRPVVVFRTGRPVHPADGQRPHASRPPLASVLLG